MSGSTINYAMKFEFQGTLNHIRYQMSSYIHLHSNCNTPKTRLSIFMSIFISF
ncbi:hypothetical protein HanPSC8_Chr08g0309111 [Helianthus annuus]|nr:hypothetical protein HanPSC8_Chr08g0309111 [Helianthus annuus]